MLITNNSENRVVIRIPMYDKHVNFSDLEIHQEILQHSRFQFLWRISGDVLTNPLEDFRYFGNNLDNEITFSFYTTTGKEILYKGLITGLKMINTDGATRGYLVTGHSHTIAMNDLKHSRLHLNKTFATIAKDTMKGHMQGLWEPEDMAPVYDAVIPSSMQSDQTDWEYLSGLAKRYGQWLFWDGTRLQLGGIKDSKMTLVNGVHIRSFGMQAGLISNKSALSGYDYHQAMQVQSEKEHTADNFKDNLMQSAISAQSAQYRRKLGDTIPFHNYSPLANQDTVDRMSRLDTAGKAAQMVHYTVETNEPVNVGHIIAIQNKTVTHHVIVTQCTFYSKGSGNFRNVLEGIPLDCIQPPYTDSQARGFGV